MPSQELAPRQRYYEVGLFDATALCHHRSLAVVAACSAARYYIDTNTGVATLSAET
jgi:hypothetical protein